MVDTTGTTTSGPGIAPVEKKASKRDLKDWMPLGDLRPGAVFELKTGARFIKLRLVKTDDSTECVSLDDGYVYDYADSTPVREIPVARMGFPKLVRSEIPAILAEQRVPFTLRTNVSENGRRAALLDKLLEEVVELWRVYNVDTSYQSQAAMEEAADVWDALRALMGEQPSNIHDRAAEKTKKRGGFHSVIIESIGEEQGT